MTREEKIKIIIDGHNALVDKLEEYFLNLSRQKQCKFTDAEFLNINIEIAGRLAYNLIIAGCNKSGKNQDKDKNRIFANFYDFIEELRRPDIAYE